MTPHLAARIADRLVRCLPDSLMTSTVEELREEFVEEILLECRQWQLEREDEDS